MATTLTFNHQLAYGQPTPRRRSGIGSRAYVWFKIVNPANGATSRREFALIDSGCDECLLDDALLSGLGLNTVASTVSVAGGGSLAVDIVQNAQIEIEGVSVRRSLTFFSGTTSIIGREIYLRAFELAFTGSDWYHS
jgi:predicted aspartyl protease